MKYKIRIILLGMVLVAAVTPAHAFTVDLDGTNATGLSDLDIGGTAYDVTFEFVAANTADGPTCAPSVPCDVFFGNQSGAIDAVDAINVALNFVSAVSVGSSVSAVYFVPYAASGGDVDVRQGDGTIGTWGQIGSSLDADTDIIEYARFSPAVVPIPPAAWLFGSALGILGWVRRQTRKTSLSS